MAGPWPFPGENPKARARRCALAYRAIALAYDPAGVRDLDRRLSGWGETWVAPAPAEYDDDDLVDVSVAAQIRGVGAAEIYRLHRAGKLRADYSGPRLRFCVRDVRALG